MNPFAKSYLSMGLKLHSEIIELSISSWEQANGVENLLLSINIGRRRQAIKRRDETVTGDYVAPRRLNFVLEPERVSFVELTLADKSTVENDQINQEKTKILLADPNQ